MPVPVMGKYQGVLFADGGKFHEHYKNIKKSVSGDKLKQFAALPTAAERSRFLLSLPHILDLQPEASQPIFSLERALEFKEKGNDAFRKHSYGEAFKFYTQAVAHCPHNEAEPAHPGNKDYSIMLANRSAALDGAGLYDACIKDIDRSIQFGYPRELWYKIYKRKGHAYVKLRQYIQAKEALEIALKNVGRSDIKKEKDRDNYRMKIRKQMTVFNVTKTLYNVEKFPRTASRLAGGEEADRGLSSKVAVTSGVLVTQQEVEAEDVLAALEPHVAVVNVSGGRAGGKICPHTLGKMFNPQPCSLGSQELFGTLEARDEAAAGYHRHEWSILANLAEVGLMERARLALRMVTQQEPADLAQLASLLDKRPDAAPPSLRAAARTLGLCVAGCREEDRLVAAVLALYLTRSLVTAGYVRVPSKEAAVLSQDEEDVYSVLERGVQVALLHTRPITLMDVPKKKAGYLDTELVTDVCGYGIYPDLPEIESAGKGPERHVFSWFLDKKLVMTSFRRLEAGQPVCLVEQKADPAPGPAPSPAPATDMITFRCANEICPNYFPLKENTKEKIISCPLEDCGLKTNIWERLKLIQRLKKDFAAAKTEFENSEVGVAKEILKGTLAEWDRIIVRPYREVEQLQALYLKCLVCEVADSEREFVESNVMGHITVRQNKPDVYPKDEQADGLTTKTFNLKPAAS